MDLPDTTSEHRGANRVILTADELTTIKLSIQALDTKMDGMIHQLVEARGEHQGHEIRIRALELSTARREGGQGLAAWLTPILLTVIALVIAYATFSASA